MEITYKEFIDNILSIRGRNGCGDEYYETHHIIPKCMGGTNDKDNLIDLYAREHYEAHKLLSLENPDNKKLAHAWWMMSTVTTSSDKRRIEITAEEYEEARKSLSKAMTGKNNPMYGKPSPLLGRHLTDEQKQHLREINLGEKSPKYGKQISEETKAKIREARLGKKASDEARLNMRNAHLGKNMGSKSCLSKQVAQYDLNGDFIKAWDCIADATREYNIKGSSISRVCKGKSKTAGNYQWRYIDGEIIYKIEPYENLAGKYQIKQIARCDENWNIIDIWDGCKAASIGTGISRSDINLCCNGKRKSAGGYKWKILNENNE